MGQKKNSEPEAERFSTPNPKKPTNRLKRIFAPKNWTLQQEISDLFGLRLNE